MTIVSVPKTSYNIYITLYIIPPLIRPLPPKATPFISPDSRYIEMVKYYSRNATILLSKKVIYYLFSEFRFHRKIAEITNNNNKYNTE
jgi:hypothetical protein